MKLAGGMGMQQEKIYYSEAAFEVIARQVLCEFWRAASCSC